MKYSKFFKFLEKKDHLINKLGSLTDEQKEEAIDFFNKHPKYENEIDWNRKDLVWEDFEEVMFKERISGAQLKNFVKKDKHFLVLYSDNNCALYQPLTWLGSRYLASTEVKPKVEGKWCISYQKERRHWDSYSLANKKSFIILCTLTTKYALEIQDNGAFDPWDAEDNKLKESDFYDKVSKEVPNIKSLLEKYIPIAINNHSSVEELHKKDLEECAHIEKVKEEEKQHRIKIFSKSFKRQVKKKGYYQWDGDISYDDLKNLGLIDEKGRVDERFKYFKISGNLDFKRSPITSITIPNNVTYIAVDAFYDCKALSKITISNRVTSIGDSAFAGCTSLTEITIPDNVTKIGWSAFQNCISLTSVIIPDSTTSIGDFTFFDCLSLTSVIIPDSITSIGDFAFAGCKSLTEITIPDSVTSIDYLTFSRCSSLKSIYIDKEKDSLDLSKARIPENTEIYWKGEF